MRTNTQRNPGTGGFTLVEILIVVGIIGLLCAIAIPSMVKARQESRISRMMNDIRIVHDAFNMYAMEHGDFPSGFVQGNSTCLLYTSPSPRDRTRSRMPSSA